MYIHIYFSISFYLYNDRPLHASMIICMTRSSAFCRARPTVRSEACSERSDEGRDCKPHITQSNTPT